MLLRQIHSVVAALLLTSSLSFVACSDDEEPVEPVQPSDVGDAAPADMEPVEPIASESYSAENIYFAFDDFTLDGASQGRVTALGDYLKNNPNAVVQIEGHCDERGSVEYNLALGERRANSVKNFLVQLGVEPARLTTISYGEEKPAAEGRDEQAWSQNRRAEFVISNQ
jgi:peptidoglycan-associated lipoprotein